MFVVMEVYNYFMAPSSCMTWRSIFSRLPILLGWRMRLYHTNLDTNKSSYNNYYYFFLTPSSLHLPPFCFLLTIRLLDVDHHSAPHVLHGAIRHMTWYTGRSAAAKW